MWFACAVGSGRTSQGRSVYFAFNSRSLYRPWCAPFGPRWRTSHPFPRLIAISTDAPAATEGLKLIAATCLLEAKSHQHVLMRRRDFKNEATPRCNFLWSRESPLFFSPPEHSGTATGAGVQLEALRARRVHNAILPTKTRRQDEGRVGRSVGGSGSCRQERERRPCRILMVVSEQHGHRGKRRDTKVRGWREVIARTLITQNSDMCCSGIFRCLQRAKMSAAEVVSTRRPSSALPSREKRIAPT